MITRIVQMTFKEEAVNEFLTIFDASCKSIRAFPGCEYLSLHQDFHQPHIFYTLSRWQTQANLDQYRESELFRSTWSQTKQLFSARPQAFSLDQCRELLRK